MSWWRRPDDQQERRRFMRDVVAEHREALVRYVAALSGDEDTGHDIVQEGLLRLWDDPKVNEAKHAKHWLYRTCRNLALDRLKQRRRRLALLADNPSAGHPEAHSSDPLEILQAEQLRERFEARIKDLPPRQREVLELRLSGGLSYREIGELLGTTRSNVGVLLHNAMKHLRAVLENTGDARVGEANARRHREVG